MKKTSEYISDLRSQTGLNNYQLAKKYGINQSNFNKYANGSAQLSVNHAFIVAKALGISAEDVLIATRIEKAQVGNNENELEFWSKQKKKDIHAALPKDNIVIVQFSPIPSDISSNTHNIISIINSHRDADVLIFPELAICGYSPEDMLFHGGFMDSIERAIELIKQSVYNTIVILGCPVRSDFINKVECAYPALHNSALMIQHEQIINSYHKQCLPNYGIFDEQRYFIPGDGTPLVFSLNDTLYSVIICEDTWSQKVIDFNINSNIDTIISINSSPFSIHKHETRLDTFLKLCRGNLGLIYVNSCFAQDDLVFDGGSFVMNKQGEITSQFDFFTDNTHPIHENILVPYEKNKYHYNALVFSLKEYFYKSNCFKCIYIALSGGIDSAFSLCLAVDAIGVENVHAVMMPYDYTTPASKEDAKTQANMLNVHYSEIPIHDIVASFSAQNIAVSGISHENIQARIRGNIIMSLANEHNALVLSTSNKSESSVGYTTLYGDMVGGFAPIKDVYKTDVYRLAKYRNTLSYAIPLSVLEKEPSAELAHNQVDSQSLPSYDELDQILQLFIDKSLSYEEIVAYGFAPTTVSKVITLVQNNEFKRRQSALGTKFSEHAFMRERRYPVVNNYLFVPKA